MVPWQAWVVFVWHATLLSFLLVTSLCDLQYLEVPLGVTVCGTLVGLVGATFLAWPFPAASGPVRRRLGWPPPPIEPGLVPVAGLAAAGSCRPGCRRVSWQLGLATGLAGALAGMIMLRAVRFLFGLGRGKEGLGIGDADVMMMAGSFIGWQPTLVAFFVGVFAALFFGVVQLIRSGDQALAFGPALALGAVVTLLAWPTIGRIPTISMLFSEPAWLGGLAAVGAVFLLLASFFLRIVRGAEPPEAPAGPESKAEPLASPPTPLPKGRGEKDAPLPRGRAVGRGRRQVERSRWRGPGMSDIVIVDYGMANLRSVQKAFEKVGHAAVISGDPNRVAEADKVVLPGVGAFRDAIARLHEADLAAPILAHLRSGKPFFGVCLGLQLLFTTSYEDGVHRGLDYFPGEVVRFKDVPGLKVPHMGWNQLAPCAGRRRRWKDCRRTRPSTSSTPTTPRRATKASSPPRPITRRRSRRPSGATTCSPRSFTRRRASASAWRCCGGSRNGNEALQPAGKRGIVTKTLACCGLVGESPP